MQVGPAISSRMPDIAASNSDALKTNFWNFCRHARWLSTHTETCVFQREHEQVSLLGFQCESILRQSDKCWANGRIHVPKILLQSQPGHVWA